MDLPPMSGVPTKISKPKESSDEVPRLPIESRSPFTQQELSQLPFSAGILPDAGEGPVKRSMEGADGKRDIKQPKTQTYPEKHSAPDVLEGERQMKQSRTSLQSSPTFAGNIRLVADYGGIDVYVEPDEDNFEPPHEECFLYLDEDYAGRNEISERQQENEGRPQLSDEEVAQLDREASLEELDRLRNLGVISECPALDGSEMVLDTRLVLDWKFREQQWKRRARLVAREFRSGDVSNEQAFSPASSKWIIHLFLTVPQKDLALVEIPDWAKVDEMRSNGVNFWKLLHCLPGQRKAASN